MDTGNEAIHAVVLFTELVKIPKEIDIAESLHKITTQQTHNIIPKRRMEAIHSASIALSAASWRSHLQLVHDGGHSAQDLRLSGPGDVAAVVPQDGV